MSSASAYGVGDLVVSSDPGLIEGGRLEERIGVIFDRRGRSCLVHFPMQGRAFWLKATALNRVRFEEDRGTPPPVLLHRLLRLVGAAGAEVLSCEGGRIELQMVTSRLDLERLRSVQELLGSDLLHLEVRPKLSSELYVVVAFRARGIPRAGEGASGE